MSERGALWTCPECGRAFANRNQVGEQRHLDDRKAR